MLRLTALMTAALFLLLCVDSFASRYPIAITGDSVVESRTLRNEANNGYAGLGASVQALLAAKGIRVGGYGFIPMHSSSAIEPYPWSFSGSWAQKGLLWYPSTKINYGADAMASETTQIGASASLGLAANRIGVVYLAGPGGARVRIRVDGRSMATFSTAAAIQRPAIYWLPISWGFHTIKLENLGGNFRLNGLIASRVQTTAREVEVDQIGHGGDTASGSFSSLQSSALSGLLPRITIIMFGSNEEAMESMSGDKTWRDRYKSGLIARAQVAKKTGKCVIVPHAPNNRSQALQEAYASVAASAAKTSGCLYRPVLKNIWNGQTSVSEGLTTDSIHPTARGNEVMAESLATLIKGLL